MSKSAVIDRRGSPLCVAPIERHLFEPGEYLCRVCRRPRAMHYHDGFAPGSTPSRLSTDPAARYRGPHPRWTRPGMYLRPEKGDPDFRKPNPAFRSALELKQRGQIEPANATVEPYQAQASPKRSAEKADGPLVNQHNDAPTAREPSGLTRREPPPAS